MGGGWWRAVPFASSCSLHLSLGPVSLEPQYFVPPSNIIFLPPLPFLSCPRQMELSDKTTRTQVEVSVTGGCVREQEGQRGDGRNSSL